MIPRLSHENGSSGILFLTRITSHTASTTHQTARLNFHNWKCKLRD